MENLVIINDNEIKLNSGLDEYMFGKTSYSSVVTQKGVYFDGENFSDWTFDEIKTLEVKGKDEPQVFYCGKNPLSGNAKSLLDFFECGNHDKMFDAAFAVCKAITVAAKSGYPLKATGAGGIIVDLSSASVSILFLPYDLFKYSTAGLSNYDQANTRNCWLNDTLSDLPSLCFFRATIAYTMLTGEFPFPSSNVVERNADILDQKFLPLELRIPQISPELSLQINKELKLTSTSVNQPGKKQKGKSSEDLKPSADFPLDLLAKEKNNIPSKEHQAELSEQIQNYIKKRDSKINTKRAVRRNTSKIVVGAILVVVIIISSISSIKSHGKEYTTQSLTSTQTIQAFLQNVNQKDATMLGNFTKGRKASKYTDTVSQVYVLSKQRSAYSSDNGFATPENYFIYVTDNYKNKSSGLYGLTHLTIDGVEYEFDITIPVFEQKLPPLTEENGVTLSKGSTIIHEVKYYLLHSEGENNDIFVDDITEEYTCTYLNGRWFISDINTKSDEIDINSTEFKLEYFETLKNNQYDIPMTIEQMSEQYPWIPSVTSVKREQQRLIDVANDMYLGIFD